MSTGKLIVVSGPSGTGKGTILSEVLANQNTKIELSISMTTRNPREGEVDGIHYYFASEAQFQQMIQEDGFLEYAKVYENYYGTPKSLVLDKLAEGTDVVLEIDIQGAMQVKQNFPQGIFVFILPPSLAVLEERIRGRGKDEEDVIALRMSEALSEIKQANQYDFAIINDDLDDAVHELQQIISGEVEGPQDINELIERY